MHENSREHKTNVLKMKNYTSRRVENLLTAQVETEQKYWIEVLKRVIAVIKKLTSRSLPFYGDDEHFGSTHNGNFLICLELLAEFDPLLVAHIERYGEKGHGRTSYFSSKTYRELILLMSDKIMAGIISEIKQSTYYSVILDSTSDITHIGQFNFVIRYLKDDSPIERIISFVLNVGHKAQDLTNALLELLEKYNLDLKFCRGQSYDNASNMSGWCSSQNYRKKPVSCLHPLFSSLSKPCSH